MTYKLNPELKEQSALENLVDAAYRIDLDIRKLVRELVSTYRRDDIPEVRKELDHV